FGLYLIHPLSPIASLPLAVWQMVFSDLDGCSLNVDYVKEAPWIDEQKFKDGHVLNFMKHVSH
ncbi:hypothetical protein L9F63_000122, partial [Diploptera punctata]